MKNSLRNLSLCALALPFLVLGTPAQAAMTGAQIKAALSGKSMTYSKGNSSGKVSYSSNGVIVVYYTYKGKPGTSTGKWWVSGSKLCSKRKRSGSKGKITTTCNTLTSLGGGKIKSSSGATLTPR